MSEILSADEIDALLSALEGVGKSSAGTEQPKRLRIYDWRRPNRFTGSEIRSVSRIHEIFTTLISRDLATSFGHDMRLRVASVDDLLMEEFIRSVPGSAFMASILMDPLRGFMIAEIDPLACDALIDLSFGAEKIERSSRRIPLSDIEMDLLEWTIIHFLGYYRESWSGVLDLRPRLSEISGTPRLFEDRAPHENIILVTMSLTGGGEDLGFINFAIPWLTLEPILGKLTPVALHRGRVSTGEVSTIRDQLATRPVVVTGEFFAEGKARLPAELSEVCAIDGRDPLNLGYTAIGEAENV